MDRDPGMSSVIFAQRCTASEPTISADYSNLRRGVESNTGNSGGLGNWLIFPAIIAFGRFERGDNESAMIETPKMGQVNRRRLNSFDGRISMTIIWSRASAHRLVWAIGFATCVVGLLTANCYALSFTGVSLAGADFGETVLPGTYNTNYTYPT